MNETIRNEANALMSGAKVAYVSDVDAAGYPNTKAMLALQRDGIATHYFSTNLSAKRTQRFLHEPKACVYYCDDAEFKGLLLIGDMQVCTDRKHRELLWREGFEMYYPKGIDDEDYCVLKFTAKTGNYYHGLQNTTFAVEEF